MTTDPIPAFFYKEGAGISKAPDSVFVTCDGRCGQYGTCEGETKPVTVKSGDGVRTWGDYHYCDLAVSETEKAGYIVLLDKESTTR